jgi:flagellar basal-body rod protein FlgB
MSVVPSQFALLRQAMQAATTRHQVISQNLANVNTPGYHAKEVTFEERLAAALEDGSAGVAGVAPEIREAGHLPEKENGNSVDIDREMTQLSKNAIVHQTLTQIMSQKISMMRSAITGQ